METDTGLSPVEAALKELHAYAKLLFLRSGRQFENKSSYRELEDEAPLDESRNDSDSLKNVPLGNPDVDLLRREFLDRLSETVSSTKGGRHVVASHMFYWRDKVKVFVAINSGFAEGDELSKFLGNLCTALKEIAAAPDNQTEEHTDALWNMLLRHQSSRLNDVIVNLRQIMKNFQHLLPQHSSPEPIGDSLLPDADGVVLDFEGCLKLLAKLLFDGSGSELERHNRLVSLSHALYRTFPAEHFQALGRAGDKLKQEIGFLGRLQTSFRALVAAAKHISGFDDLSLIPVARPKTRKKTPSQEWSLATTLQALNLQQSDAAIDNLMTPSSSKARWTEKKLRADFSRLKSPTREVHAEIQLIVYILSHPGQVANGKRFDYVGCSRYSCLLCSKFLHCFQAIKTRGCHGKLYNHSWTLPPGDGLGEGEQHMLCGTVVEVISWMREELIGSRMISVQWRAEAKESTIGGSIISFLGLNQEDHQRNHAVSEHLHRQRAQSSHMQFNNESLPNRVEDEEASTIQTRHETFAESTAKLCTTCWQEETTRRCSHCRASPFCGKDCERDMPLSHLLKCNMRQVTSADYLYEDICKDELATDPQVRQDYWFDRCQTKNEESHLLGLFAGLFRYHHNCITREELHQWRSDPGGNPYLVAKIVEKFEEIRSENRGLYFPWFLRQRARFELPAGDDSVPNLITQVRNMEARARKYLASEDQHKDVQHLTPLAKKHCFIFYSMLVDNGYPPPLNREHSHWFDFGFVVTDNEHEERQLGSMYNTILFGSKAHEEYERSIGSSILGGRIKKHDPICSFDEFWKAWERGTLMTMFDKCWPELKAMNISGFTEYRILGRLRVFLEAKKPRPSIWKLRHFLAIEDVSVESAVSEIAWAARDYGFSEQLDTRTTMELKDFYMKLFKKAEPLAIHGERMKGNLVQFAELHVDTVTPRVKELLQGLPVAEGGLSCNLF